MAKPSIFSKNYEKKMRQRRLKIGLIIAVVVIVALGLFYRFKLKDMNLNQMINELQAWVNNEPVGNETKPAVNETEKNKETKPIAKPEENVKLEFNLVNNEKVIFNCKEENSQKIFESIETKGYEYDISPNKKEVVIEDKNQNIFLLNVNGKIKNITRQEYVSRSGNRYSKEKVLKLEKDAKRNYIWGSNPKFVDNSTIAYISNLPYFGNNNLKKYIWLYNTENNSNKAIWETGTMEIKLLNRNEAKNGINVKIGNKEYILDNTGKLLTE